MAETEEWRLVWSDEFEGPEIDPAKWEHQVFPGVDSGNNELQHYTNRPDNSFIRDGKLVIHAKRENYQNHDYTSARLHTRGRFSFKYGRVEGRIKIPSTVGIWPAFWMMPEHSVYGTWPRSGEIDIMESVNIADTVYGTIHFGNPSHMHTGAPYRLPVNEGEQPRLFSDDFHVYAIEWDPTEIRWYVDGNHFSTLNRWTAPAPYPAPFDQEFHLLLNVAVGGNWPGSPDATSEFPQEMVIDWVRVYQRTNQPPSVRIISPEVGSRLRGGEDLILKVKAEDADGTIARVALQIGDEIVAEATEAPFTIVYTAIPDGCYKRVMVYAFDDNGLRSQAETSFIVGAGCPQQPYGNGIVLPGVLEAEHFDEGMPGEAYYDTTDSNAGGAARLDEWVDLGSIDGGGIALGWTEAGEWLEYTVQVSEAGTYRISSVGASAQAGGEIAITSTAAPGQRAVAMIPRTGNWHRYARTEGGLIKLPEGEVVLRLEIVRGGINLDKVEFELLEAVGQ